MRRRGIRTCVDSTDYFSRLFLPSTSTAILRQDLRPKVPHPDCAVCVRQLFGHAFAQAWQPTHSSRFAMDMTIAVSSEKPSSASSSASRSTRLNTLRGQALKQRPQPIQRDWSSDSTNCGTHSAPPRVLPVISADMAHLPFVPLSGLQRIGGFLPCHPCVVSPLGNFMDLRETIRQPLLGQVVHLPGPFAGQAFALQHFLFETFDI